ncbi:similar to Saccharomyces cerevisiae YJL049W Putative protein of unknown function [Maudiozyma saulgeensis]|uniref:Uncharacterized protein n=1 Tax=Maudiozyma saulgeensis TaxID=1789683 RepID=A0A1X7R3W8_9SACH|nr:similar to Saccharomyces cerevisiae YJL049W Putative protein of unknown function [Kazachstania saulgeensis]
MKDRTDLPTSRLGSLYRDFRDLKDLNPDGYQANINTWEDYFLTNLLNDTNTLSVNCGKNLLHKLNNGIYGEPKSIDVVIDEFVSKKILIPSETYFDVSKVDIGNDSNNTSILSRLFGLLRLENEKKYTSRLRKLGDTYLKTDILIVNKNVKKSGEEIADKINKNIINKSSEITDLVMSTDEFLKTAKISEIWKDKTDQNIMLFYLEHHLHLIITDQNIVKVIADLNKKELEVSNQKITDVDIGIVDIKLTLDNLNKQIAKLENEIRGIETKLYSDTYKSLSRTTQKGILKNKIVSQRYLEKLSGNKNNLTQIMRQLNMSLINKTMFDTLKQSHAAILSINNYIGSIDKVSTLLENIEVENEKTNELNDILSRANDLDNSVSEDEVNNELAELEKQMEREKQGEQTTEVSKDSSVGESEVLELLKNVTIEDRSIEKTEQNESNTNVTREKNLELAN